LPSLRHLGHLSRREFLAASSASAAALVLAPQRAVAIPARSRLAVNSFADPILTPDELRAFARAAMETATQEGAQFADIRIGDLREYIPAGVGSPGRLWFKFGYGVRARVNGREAFVGSADPTRDGVIRATRTAVATARGLGAISGPTLPFAQVPVVTGEWKSPVKIDPFEVSPDDHVYVRLGYNTWNRHTGVTIFSGFHWQNEIRVFASTEGSLTTQHMTRVLPFASVDFSSWRMFTLRTWYHLPWFVPQTAGFEAILGPERHNQLEAAIDDMAELATYPVGKAEVGRRDVVLDGTALAEVLAVTVTPSVSVGRILGEEQNSGGVSFLAPIESAIGQKIGSPVLNVWVEQGAPHYGAAQWDDEGVATTAFPLVEHGKVSNLLATRANVAALTQGTGQPALPRGSAFAADLMAVPGARPGTLAVRAAGNGPSLAELTKTLGDGYVIRDAWMQMDQQASSGTLNPYLMFEVKRGKIVRRAPNGRIDFVTKKFLGAITALGGESSVGPGHNTIDGGLPWSQSHNVITAPAAYVRDATIVSSALSVG